MSQDLVPGLLAVDEFRRTYFGCWLFKVLVDAKKERCRDREAVILNNMKGIVESKRAVARVLGWESEIVFGGKSSVSKSKSRHVPEVQGRPNGPFGFVYNRISTLTAMDQNRYNRSVSLVVQASSLWQTIAPTLLVLVTWRFSSTQPHPCRARLRPTSTQFYTNTFSSPSICICRKIGSSNFRRSNRERPSG